mmetsp:Transcript_39431/g.118074  ORF Transcript_39431/g.118074 Transcript_39431/m.118074 type:complete len:491 (+) Transcript_39431:39-1511(+)
MEAGPPPRYDMSVPRGDDAFEPAPSREGCCVFWFEVAGCLSAAPCGWLRFGVQFVCCSLREFCVLCILHDGDARMGAIERLMRRVADGVPRELRALQLATDVTARIPMLRHVHLALSGRGVNACDARAEVGGGEWIWLDRRRSPLEILAAPKEERRLVFYVHGGAFVLCNAATHRAMTCNVARVTGALVLAVDYRRPPEHKFPTALEDVVEAYRFISTRFQPERIIVAGESAGGNLAVALCLRLSQLGAPMPGGLILMSPWTDLSDRSFPSWDKCKDYLPPDLIAAFAEAYVGSEDARQELVSPLYSGSLRVLPQTLLVYGSGESLAGQFRRFEEALRSSGVSLSTYVGPGQVHAFPVYADITYGSLGQATVMAAALASAASLLALVAAFVAFVAAAVGTPARVVQLVVVCAIAFAAAQVLLAWLRKAHLRDTMDMVGSETSGSSIGSDLDGEDESLSEGTHSGDERPPPFEAYRQIGVFARQVWSCPDV